MTQHPTDNQTNEIGEEDALKIATDDEIVDDFSGEIRDLETTSELLQQREFLSVYIVDKRHGNFFEGTTTTVLGDIGYTGPGRSSSPAARNKTYDASLDGKRIPKSAERLRGEDFVKLKKVYVKIGEYDEALAALQRSSVLILYGRAAYGKWATAIHMLSNLHEDQVFELNPTVPITKLDFSDADPEQGYVLQVATPAPLEEISSFVLRRLAEQLRSGHSHLVITVDSRISLPRDIFSEWVVHWRSLPTPQVVLDNHLFLYLAKDDQRVQARELANTPPIKDLLRRGLSPRDSDHLASLLAGVVHGDFTLDQALSRFHSQALAGVEAWFDTHPDLEYQTLFVSATVLSGVSHNLVFQEKNRLLDAMTSVVDQNNSIQSQPFLKRTQALQEVGAYLEDGFENSESGLIPVQLVKLENPTLQPIVLKHLWHEYERWQQSLLEWLREMVNHPLVDLRLRAAAAIGELSKHDYPRIRREVFMVLANHPNERLRRAVALSFAVPALDDSTAPLVLGMLHHWCTLRNNWKLVWTAAVTYGGLVGIRYPNTALQDLHEILRVQDVRVLRVAILAIRSLFTAGHFSVDYYIIVINALATWINEDSEAIRLNGTLAFLEIARHSISPDTALPTMLVILKDMDVTRAPIAKLLRCALNNRSTRDLTLELVRDWLHRSGEETSAEEPLHSLVFGLYRQGEIRERRRWIFYLERWSRTLPSAERLSARISGPEQ